MAKKGYTPSQIGVVLRYVKFACHYPFIVYLFTPQARLRPLTARSDTIFSIVLTWLALAAIPTESPRFA